MLEQKYHDLVERQCTNQSSNNPRSDEFQPRLQTLHKMGQGDSTKSDCSLWIDNKKTTYTTKAKRIDILSNLEETDLPADPGTVWRTILRNKYPYSGIVYHHNLVISTTYSVDVNHR